MQECNRAPRFHCWLEWHPLRRALARPPRCSPSAASVPLPPLTAPFTSCDEGQDFASDPGVLMVRGGEFFVACCRRESTFGYRLPAPPHRFPRRKAGDALLGSWEEDRRWPTPILTSSHRGIPFKASKTRDALPAGMVPVWMRCRDCLLNGCPDMRLYSVHDSPDDRCLICFWTAWPSGVSLCVSSGGIPKGLSGAVVHFQTPNSKLWPPLVAYPVLAVLKRQPSQT